MTTASSEGARRFADRYELVRELGRGGMGVVHLAYDVELHREVALKVNRSRSHSCEERFRREFRALAAIRHTGVPAILHNGRTSEGEAYFTMELVRGETLRAQLEAGPIEPRRALALAIDLGRVLAAVHAVGVVHRDVKPSNIIVEPGDHVRLIDFGACYLTGDFFRQPHLRSVTATGRRWGTGDLEFVGTQSYTDPECFSAGATSPRSDVFSVCVALYEMITGRRLLDEATLRFREIDAREFAPELAPLVVELRRGAALESFERHASMEELVRALEIVRGGLGEAPGPRRRARLAVAGVAAGAFVLGGLAAILSLRPASDPHAPGAAPSSVSVASQAGEGAASEASSPPTNAASQPSGAGPAGAEIASAAPPEGAPGEAASAGRAEPESASAAWPAGSSGEAASAGRAGPESASAAWPAGSSGEAASAGRAGPESASAVPPAAPGTTPSSAASPGPAPAVTMAARSTGVLAASGLEARRRAAAPGPQAPGGETRPVELPPEVAAAEGPTRRCLEREGATPRSLVVTLHSVGDAAHVQVWGVASDSVHARCVREAFGPLKLPPNTPPRRYTLLAGSDP